MGKSHDYQNEMGTETRSLDTLGEQAAEATTAETAPVHEQKIVTSVGNATYTKTRGTFGVLPQHEIPDDYARERMLYFKNLAIETGTRRNPLNPLDPGTNTAAYKSQKYMAEAYYTDLSSINTAQRQFDLLVPLTAMAAKSFAKAHEIGQLTGFSDQHGPELSAKEQRSLNKAAREHHSPLDEEPSLHAVSLEMRSARHSMEKASIDLSLMVRSSVLKQLLQEYDRATADKAAIQAKIDKAQSIANYLGTAASMVAGGAGFVHEHISIGKPHPLAGKAPEEHDLRDSSIEGAQSAGKQAHASAGLAGSAVAFGMKLYYEDEFAKIAATQDVLLGLLDKEHARQEQDKVTSAYTAFAVAQSRYAETVSKYQARVNDRRKHMASLGTTADKLVDPKGRDANASDAMLWTATLMETQSFLGTAIDAARETQSTVNAAYRGEDGLRSHRHHPWGTLSDMYGPNNTPRKEGEVAPDIVALKQMRNLVTLWLEGAEDVATKVAQAADSQGRPVLEMVGYTAEY